MKFKKIIIISVVVQLTSLLHATTTIEITNATNSLKAAQTTLDSAINKSKSTTNTTSNSIVTTTEINTAKDNLKTAQTALNNAINIQDTAPAPITAPAYTQADNAPTPIAAPSGYIAPETSPSPILAPQYIPDIVPAPITAPAYTQADNAPTPIAAPSGYIAPETSPSPILAPQYIPDIVPAPITAPTYVKSMKDISIRNKEINDEANIGKEALIDAQYNARELAIIDKWEVQSYDTAPLPIAAPRLNPVAVCGMGIEQKMGQTLVKYNNNTNVKLRIFFKINEEEDGTEIPANKCFAQFIAPGSIVDIAVYNASKADSDGNISNLYQTVLADINLKSCNITLDAHEKPVISLIS